MRQFSTTQPSTITSALIAINVGIFIADQLSGGIALGGYDSFEDFGLLYGPVVADGEWWRLITGGFLHANVTHLLMNMLALYQTGPILERALGPARFIALYMAALLAGSAGVMLIEADAPTVGASGAIFGLFGALFVGMRRRGIDVWRSGIGTLIVINLVITFAIPFVSKGGHLGGLVGGGVAGWLMCQGDDQRRSDNAGVAVGVAVAAVSVVIALAMASAS